MKHTMARRCIVDGVLRGVDEPLLSVYDRSFMLGDGLFETVLVRDGKAVWLPDHYARMKGSAAFFAIPFPYSPDEFAAWCVGLIAANGIEHGFLRIALSRGASLSGRFADLPVNAPLLVIVGGATTPQGEELPRIAAALAPWPLNECDPLLRHKTASRMHAVYARQHAAQMGVDELIFCNTRGEVAEGIFSNVFWSRDGALYTPSSECGVLPGTARARVIGAARALRIDVNEGAFAPGALCEADSIFFTNALMVIAHCSALEGKSPQIFSPAKEIERLVLSAI